MKYSDVVQFQPIMTVIQLKEANDAERAKELIETFVISQSMEERIIELLLPNLQFDDPMDNKGTLIVGNYGTGKSHFMSVISSIAEEEKNLDYISNQTVKSNLENIAGKFKVVRTEIGGVRMSLREIVLKKLELTLAQYGIEYSFPSADEVINNKDNLIEMMGLFHEMFPDHGFLFVIDELLDYLLSRSDQELVMDLNFLRELGEICPLTRFRFIAGLQESLFDSPRFRHVAKTLLKVKDRFIQFRIVREDVAFVVAERLLKKSDKQKVLVRNHLEKFISIFPIIGKNEKAFINLYPIHPNFIDTFQNIEIAEKREILKTISQEIEKEINKEIPDDHPGIITYDRYWKRIKENPSLKTINEIREVIKVTSDLENLIQQSFPKKIYKKTALKIINGLSVHRLTIGDIYAKIGITLEDIRDNLFPYIEKMPEKSDDFIITTLETILKDILRTVSHEYISFNKENGQYYLDLRKTTNFEAKIKERAINLDANVLDRYYFNLLRKIMQLNTSTYVTGFNIWEYEIKWNSHNVKRPGYLFFGAPNERSTAHPPKEFYIYFIQAFDPKSFKENKKSDEVFFYLDETDEVFDSNLKLYAAANLLAERTKENRSKYLEKAKRYIEILIQWLNNNSLTSFTVSYQGVYKKLNEVMKVSQNYTFRDLIDKISSDFLKQHFNELRPDYPEFSHLITKDNLKENVKEAINYICRENGGTNLGKTICMDLELIKDNHISTDDCKYATYIKKKIKNKKGKVINRNELFEGYEGEEYDKRFKLEPEWLIVILIALIYDGSIVLKLNRTKIDASNLNQIISKNIQELTSFKHIEPPKDLPLATLIELSKLLNIPQGNIKIKSNRKIWIKSLQSEVHEEIKRIINVLKNLNDGILIFGERIFDKPISDDYKKAMNQYKAFLENIQFYNTVGKLKNFKYTKDDIDKQYPKQKKLKKIKSLINFIQSLSSLNNYFQAAVAILPDKSEIFSDIKNEKDKVLNILKNEENWNNKEKQYKLKRSLNSTKSKYIKFYLNSHKKSRLGLEADKQKNKLLKHKRLTELKKLANIDFLPKNKLNKFIDQLVNLKTCFGVTEDALSVEPKCPHCNFNPRNEMKIMGLDLIEKLEENLFKMHENWKRILLDNLNDSTVAENIPLLKKEKKELLNNFIDKEEFPSNISNIFVEAIEEVFQGLIKVEITLDDIEDALTAGGTPCTPNDMKQRLLIFLDKKIANKEIEKVRIIIK